MVLLKIILWIFVGLIVFDFFIRIFITLVIWLKSFYQTRRLLNLIRKHSDFLKLLDRAESQGIEIRAVTEGGWALLPTLKIILADINDVKNISRQKFGLIAFAHEIAHFEYWKKRKGQTCLSELRKTRRSNFLKFGCLWEEMLASIGAWHILKEENIEIDEKEFWKEAESALISHCLFPCPIFSECPKKEAIFRMIKFLRVREGGKND